jgi:hypothetical protein
MDLWKQVAAEITALLRPPGFRRSASVFYRQPGPGVAHTLEIRRFRWNVGELRKFQLFAGVYLADASGVRFSPKNWHPHHSAVFLRDVAYFKDQDLQLFDVPPRLPDPAFSEALRHSIQAELLPFFASTESVDAVVAMVERENRRRGLPLFSFLLAQALAKLGRRAESQKYFRESMRLGDPKLIRQMAALQGIELDSDDA